MALVEPRMLLSLGADLFSKVATNFDELLEGQRSGIDLDADIEDQYEVISSGLEVFETLLAGSEELGSEAIFREANERLRDEINEVEQEQEQHRASQENDGD